MNDAIGAGRGVQWIRQGDRLVFWVLASNKVFDTSIEDGMKIVELVQDPQLDTSSSPSPLQSQLERLGMRPTGGVVEKSDIAHLPFLNGAELAALMAFTCALSFPNARRGLNRDPQSYFVSNSLGASVWFNIAAPSVFLAAHEGAHYLCARAFGLKAEIKLARRGIFPGAVTVMPGVRARTVSQQLCCSAGGIVGEVVTLGAVERLSRRWPESRRWVRGVGLMVYSSILSQCYIFFRSDAHAGLSALLREPDPHGVMLRYLSEPEAIFNASADERRKLASIATLEVVAGGIFLYNLFSTVAPIWRESAVRLKAEFEHRQASKSFSCVAAAAGLSVELAMTFSPLVKRHFGQMLANGRWGSSVR